MQKKPLMVSASPFSIFFPWRVNGDCPNQPFYFKEDWELIIFLAVALAHVWRYLLKVPVTFGATQVPLWLSFVGAVAAFLLALWMFKAAGKQNS